MSGHDDRPWFGRQYEVLAFGEALGHGGELDGWAGALAYVARPWKWDDAYQQWCRAGRPKRFEVPR